MANSGRSTIPWTAAVLLVLAVFGAAVLSFVSRPAGAPAATWWPAAGVAVVLLGLTPRRWWWWLVPSVLLTTGAANLLGDRTLDQALWLAVANAAEALVVATFLRRDRRTLPELASLDSLVRLVLGAALGAAVFATIAATGLGLLEGAGFLDSWWPLAVSHNASVLVIAPLAMAPHTRPSRRLAWELPLQLAALTAVTLLVFAPSQSLSLEFLPLPLLLWAALRFDERTVAWEIFAFAVVVTVASLMGHGPIGYDNDRGALSSVGMGAVVQTYVLVAALMSLPLAIGVEQRRSSERLFRRNFTESIVGMVLMRSRTGRPFEVTDVNDAAAAILPAGTVGRSLVDVLETDEPLALIAARMVSGRLDGWKSQVGVRGRPGTHVEIAVSLLGSEPEPTFAAQLLDVSTEYQAHRRLEAAEKLTSATLDTTAAMILVTDLYGVVVRVNGATTALTGFAEDELLGSEIWDIAFAPPGSEGFPAGLPEDVHSQVSRETDAVTKHGERRRVLWNTGYVHDERNRATHVVLTGIDLTAERVAAGLNRHLLEAAITTALIGIDPRGLITVFNAGAVNLLGYDAQDMVGTSFVDLLDRGQVAERCGGTEGEEAFARLINGIEKGGETALQDWAWIGADGRRHTVSMTISIAADRVAARIGYLCVGRDVTEARASQELLIAALGKERMAVERMRQLDDAKSVFVSTVSHELRTPVTSIVGYTEMLEDGTVVEPAEQQRPLLDSIRRNAQRLISLCNDLLTLGGLDSGATRWERETIDLATILPAAEETVRPLLAGRDLTLTFASDPTPLLVLGDRVQLERVVVNLLGNAVKFTEDGGSIECRLEQHDGEVWLAVSDTGIGIPEDEQSGVFQRFFRSSTAQRRAIQGTGLGLSIVAATVAAHGGRIDVRSAHLEGTTFTVRLPQMRAGAVRPGSPR